MRLLGARTSLTGLTALTLVMASTLLSGNTGRNQRSAELLRAGYRSAYNLDHDEALAAFHRAVETDPDDPAAYRAVAAITWLNLLYTRGALTADEFLSSLPESNSSAPPPPPDVAATFRTNIDKSMDLAETQVRLRPRDASAQFNLGAARGLLAAYTVTVEGSLFGAVSLARGAVKAMEQVLALDPSRKDAAFFTGSYRYAVANLSSVKRWLAYLAGFSGDREVAIRLLEESAAYPSDVQADARFLLVLVYNRERRYDDALRMLEGLRRDFPRNRLLWLESGATEKRAGRMTHALEFLNAGIEFLDRDARPKAFGEAAMWHAKRGAVYAALGETANAEADLKKALAAEGRVWVRGRCHIELGKLADLSGNRTAATAEYRLAMALCGNDRDPIGRAEAEKYLNSPFTGTNAGPGRQ